MMRIKTIVAGIALSLLACSVTAQERAASSLLGSGRWVKIAVTEEGLYRLDYSQLRSMGFTDPASVALYGNNAGQLSFYNDGSSPDDLRPVAFMTEKGGDGIFNEGDYLVFYAEATHRRVIDRSTGEYRYLRHHYSDTAWYFLTSRPGGGVPVEYEPTVTQPHNRTSSSTDVFIRHERDEVNLIRSGREWFQQVTPGVAAPLGEPGLRDLVPGSMVKFTIRVLARSDAVSTFTLRYDGQTAATIAVPGVDLSDLNGTWAATVTMSDSLLPLSSSPGFALSFSPGSSTATGYIDYAEFTGRASLVYRGLMLAVSDSRSVGPGTVTRFTVTGPPSLMVWDVTNPFVPLAIPTTPSSGNILFTAVTDTLRRFVVFTPADLKRPVRSMPVAEQNLHVLASADMIIVTHPLFKEYARRLAEIHSDDDGTTSIIVTPEQIYNEFSGGVPDAVAIRNFVKMIWERGRNSAKPLRYLLLFGDGSYENRRPPPGNSSFIPTWQSLNSTSGILSFTSDDFYGLLDDGEGEADGYLDIGIGRLPVYDTTTAGIMVRKISTYLDPASRGSWQNIIALVADDEDSNLHMHDAEGLAAAAAGAAPPLTVEKIYLDSFRQVTTATGASYPDATRAIDDRITAGCLIMNYVGHGNESGLAHEGVVRPHNINSWKNSTMLPLFITATCEFSRFDNVEINRAAGTISARHSAGEMVLLNPDGGGIALMSTTRVVYSAPNYTLNKAIFENAFRTAADGEAMRLGDIIRQAKISSGGGLNKRSFLLLGDPALRLAWPAGGRVVTDSINGIHVSMQLDTLRALAVVTVSGHIEAPDGSLMSGFNGTVEPTVLDKPAWVSTLANDGGTPMRYQVTGNVLFRGKTTATSGRFRFSFMMPLDINYSYGKGAIKYYARDEANAMNDSYEGITVGGFSQASFDDTEGPQIRLFMNDTLFRNGGVTNTTPTLLALLSDRSGINATGTGIGHDIIAWLDDDITRAVVLNSHFTADVGVHSSGRITYPLTIAERGEHTLSLRAWDNLNNPSVATLRFVVESDGTFRLTNPAAFPNPATGETRITAGHNRPGEVISLTISIFTSDGRIVRTLRQESRPAGYVLPETVWDGCDSNGGRVAKGVYLWRAEAVGANGEKASATGRIIIL